MMQGFEDDSGKYRNHGEGIIRDGKIIYRAPDSILVPSLMKSLFNLLDEEEINKIIKNSAKKDSYMIQYNCLVLNKC